MMRIRALFLSDIHLGSRACQAERLLAFLKTCDCRTIFLLGDIVDFWALKRVVYWPESHNTVVQKLLRLARHGVRIYYIPGNHDEALKNYLDSSFGNVRLKKDYVTTCARWLSVLGDVSYDMLVDLNRALSWVRRKLRLVGHWSLADYAKRKLQGAASFISGFEVAIARHAKALQVDGVICGHIHTPVIKRLDGVLYLNCGDWVDSCTAIVEHVDGRMELVRHTAASDEPGERSSELAEAA
jgi:UDP-2,3-diacylglucosamine pyrophosphatase LpxH